MRNVYCVDNDDEIGLFEKDELYFLFSGTYPGGKPFKRQTAIVEGVDEDDWVFKKGEVIIQSKIDDGQFLEAVAVLVEHDAGKPKKLLDILASGVENISETGDILGGLVITALETGVHQVFERGGDDILGAVRIRVSNVNGELRKELVPLKQTKIGGYKKIGALSKTKMTLRTEMYHKAAANNIVRYIVSFNVRDMERISNAHPEGEPLLWSIAGGKAY
jgi:hypothetical protein